MKTLVYEERRWRLGRLKSKVLEEDVAKRIWVEKHKTMSGYGVSEKME